MTSNIKEKPKKSQFSVLHSNSKAGFSENPHPLSSGCIDLKFCWGVDLRSVFVMMLIVLRQAHPALFISYNCRQKDTSGS